MESTKVQPMSLHGLGVDVVRDILNWLPGAELGRLYLTGDRSIIFKMTKQGAVRRIHLDYDFETDRLFWPQLATHFAHLIHFAYMRGRVKGSVEFSMTYEHLMMLPPSLESIWLGGDKAEFCWFKDNGPPKRTDASLENKSIIKAGFFDIETRFPNLRKLMLRETAGPVRGLDDASILALPDSILWLSLYWNGTITSKSFQHMPKNLHTLRFGTNSNMDLYDCPSLPSSITKLILARMEIHKASNLLLLLRTLHSLVAKFQSIPSNALSTFPTGLVKLGVVPLNSNTIPLLPHTITCLIGLDASMESVNLLASLPAGLRHLQLSTNTSNEVFSMVPRKLEVIRFRASAISFDKSILELAPKTLRVITLVSYSGLFADPTWQNFPIRIVPAPPIDY
jgi:hypothetical protein